MKDKIYGYRIRAEPYKKLVNLALKIMKGEK